MPIERPLDEIWQEYLCTVDCLKITQRSINKSNPGLLAKTTFMQVTQEAANQQIEQSRANADDYVILSLWVVFERMLLLYAQNESQRILAGSASEFTRLIHEKIANDIEYWKTGDLLDFFKIAIAADLIGQAKQIKAYRDWVAHRNEKKGSPANVSPKMAYAILAKIITQLDENDMFCLSMQMPAP
jgi:hypothetical protein